MKIGYKPTRIKTYSECYNKVIEYRVKYSKEMAARIKYLDLKPVDKRSIQNKIDLEGRIMQTTHNGPIKILKYYNNINVLIQFLNTGYTTFTTKRRLDGDYDELLGEQKILIKDPYVRSVYGIGYYDIGPYVSRENANDFQYIDYVCWKEMLKRCYSMKYKMLFPTYIGCIVDPFWHSFQNFAAWFESAYSRIAGYDGRIEVDKDILGGDQKYYSMYNCCLVPQEINTVISNTMYVTSSNPTQEEKNMLIDYKYKKEHNIRNLANKYKEFLEPRVYSALINYNANITEPVINPYFIPFEYITD